MEFVDVSDSLALCSHCCATILNVCLTPRNAEFMQFMASNGTGN